MGTTPNYAIPYPELTDPPDSPAQTKSLALTVDTLLKAKFVERAADGSIGVITGGVSRPIPFAMQAGKSVVTFTAGSAFSSSTVVTFAASRFAAAPVVVSSCETVPWVTTMCGSITMTGMTVSGRFNATPAIETDTIDWWALQMTPTTSPGRAASQPTDIVTCHTPGCDNEDIPIPLLISRVDPIGNPALINVMCGVCGQPITDITAA